MIQSKNLGNLLEILADSEIEYILVGGLAAVTQGAPITTMDVDIVHRRTEENINKLLITLEQLEAIHRRPDDKILKPSIRDLSGKGHILLITRLGPLDILGTIERGLGYESLIGNSIEIEFRGKKIRILSLRKIVELKKESSDPKDRQKLPVLIETLRQKKNQDSN